MMMWMAAIGARLIAQDLRIDPNDAAAIRTSVETLAQHVGQFAGLRVRVADAIVERVVSPRAFILIGQRAVTNLNLSRDRVGVIIESGTVTVVQSMPIVVIGAAGTFLGGQVSGVLTRSEALTDTERNALSRYPLVVALSVQTPGNVNLLHGALPAPAPTTATNTATATVSRVTCRLRETRRSSSPAIRTTDAALSSVSCRTSRGTLAVTRVPAPGRESI